MNIQLVVLPIQKYLNISFPEILLCWFFVSVFGLFASLALNEIISPLKWFSKYDFF